MLSTHKFVYRIIASLIVHILFIAVLLTAMIFRFVLRTMARVIPRAISENADDKKVCNSTHLKYYHTKMFALLRITSLLSFRIFDGCCRRSTVFISNLDRTKFMTRHFLNSIVATKYLSLLYSSRVLRNWTE